MLAPSLLAALRPAQTLLVGRRGGISDVIKAVTRSEFSHVAQIGQSFSGAWLVIEATTSVKGVASRQLEVITDDPSVESLALYEHVDIEDYHRRLVDIAAWLQTGEEYSNRVNWDILVGVPVEEHEGFRSGVNCALMRALADHHAGLSTIDLARPTPQAFAVSPSYRRVWRRP